MSAARHRRPRRPGETALKRIAFAWLAGAALVAALAGCGGGKKEAPPPPAKAAVRVYFLLHGKVQPVRRLATVHEGGVVLGIDPLRAGPSAAEKQRGLTTAVPHLDGKLVISRTGNGPLTIKNHLAWSKPALAQLVYTLTQRGIRQVALNGKLVTRKTFEDQTPSILVESPLPEQKIKSPLHVKGTANTFEATFQYELRDLDGKVVARHFVTATSGTGTRGTFDFSTPFSFHHAGMGALVVYELSAEDGSRIHQVEIPVEFTR